MNYSIPPVAAGTAAVSGPLRKQIQAEVRVGTYQCEPVAGDAAENIVTLERIAAMAAKDHGLDVVLFPELFLTGYNAGVERLQTLAVAVDSNEIRRIQSIAAAYKIAIAVGYPERWVDKSTGKLTIFNSCCLIDACGSLVLNYRKTHLWDPDRVYEKLVFTAGDSLPVAELQLLRTGQVIVVGILICFDLEFSEPCRVLACKGAEIVLVPTGSGDATPTSLCNTRAMENHIFIVYCNLIGPLKLADTATTTTTTADTVGGVFAGRSAVLAPDGSFLARADGTETGLFMATLDRVNYMDFVHRNDYLVERRPELYSVLSTTTSSTTTTPISGRSDLSVPHQHQLQSVPTTALVTTTAPIVLFNAAGDSPMPAPVLTRVKAFLDREAEIGGYAAAEEVEMSGEMTSVYDCIGRLIHAARPREEIALVDSATTAWTRAFYSLQLKPGDVVLTTVMEYASNYLAMLQQAQRTGADIQVLPCGVNGTISVPALQELMASPVGHRVKVVSVVWIPTNSGVVNDVAAVGAVIAASGRAADIVFMIDACQAVGQISIDVVALGCQVLTGTGRKYLRGPRGTGFLYVQHAALDRHLAEPVTIDLRSATWLRALATTTTTTESVADQGNGDTCKHSDDQSCLTTAPYEYTYTVAAGARRFEQWERNVAGLIGLGAAVSYLLDTVGEKHAYSELVRLAMCLRRRLTGMRSDGVIVWDRCSSCTSSYSRRDRGTTTLVTESSTNKYTAVDVDVDAIADDSSSLCGLVTFTVHGVDAQIVKQELETCRMYVSVTYPSSSWLDASARSLPTAGLVRASLHYYNTTDEIEKFCCELKRIIEKLSASVSK